MSHLPYPTVTIVTYGHFALSGKPYFRLKIQKAIGVGSGELGIKSTLWAADIDM